MLCAKLQLIRVSSEILHNTMPECVGDSAGVIVGCTILILFYTCFVVGLIKAFQCSWIVTEDEYEPDVPLEERILVDDTSYGEDVTVVADRGGGHYTNASISRLDNFVGESTSEMSTAVAGPALSVDGVVQYGPQDV